MQQTKKRKVVCITTLDHLPKVYDRLSYLCDVKYVPNISKENLRILLLEEEFDSIFTNPNKQGFTLDYSLLKETSIRLINTASTGTNHINFEDCLRLGIQVLSLTKDYDLIRNLPSTSELGFGLALSLMRKIPQSFEDVKHGNWNYEPFVGRQLLGLTAGIIGYGRLGTFMAKYCNAFGMKVLVNDPNKNVFDYEQVTKEKLFEESDLISLHVHVKDDTKGLINDQAISLMNKNPFIVNTSRGEIVDEASIATAIVNNRISGYGTDVLTDEFSGNIKKNNLLNLSKQGYNIIITPHIGGMSLEGQEKAYFYAVEKFGKV
jgi:D-3-phosphoglycerate dehydrogenase